MNDPLKNFKASTEPDKPVSVPKTPIDLKDPLKNFKAVVPPKKFETDYAPIVKQLGINTKEVDMGFIASMYEGQFSKVYAENSKKAQADAVARAITEQITNPNKNNPFLKQIDVGIPNVLANLKQKNKSYSEDFVDKYKTLEKHNTAFLKALKNGGGDMASTYTNAYNAFQDFKTTLAPENFKNDSKYVIRPEDNKFMAQKDYDREHDGPSGVWNKKTGAPVMSSTLDTNFDLGYKTIVNHEKAIQQTYLKYSTPVMGAWTANSSKILNKYAAGGKDLDEDDIDNAQKSFAYTTDLLTHVSKYGTVTGDSKNKDRGVALGILREANGIKDPKAKYAYLAKQGDAVTKLAGSLGFYGTKYLFEKHHDSLNHDDFYGNSDSVAASFNQGGVDRQKDEILKGRQGMVRTGLLFNRWSKVDSASRNQAKEKMYGENLDVDLSDFVDQNTLINSFLTKDGRVRTRADFEQTVNRESMKKAYKGAKINFDEMTFKDGKYTYQGKTDWSPVGLKITQDDNRHGKKYDEAYDRMNKIFVKKFNEVDPSEKYENSLMLLSEDKNGNKIGGFGNNTSQVVALRGLDFSNKNSTGNMEKFKTIQNVLSMVNNQSAENSIFNIQGGVYITDQNIDKKLNSFKNEFQENDETIKKLHSFLKTAGENVTAEFYAHPGGNRQFSSYVFRDEDTGKKMAMFIPNDQLQTIKDPHYAASQESTSDFTYNYTGEKPLLNTRDFKQSKIVNKDGMLVGKTSIPSLIMPGSFEDMEFNIGPASSTKWDDAELHFYEALKQYKELQKQEEK